ncbi:alpha/beta hydrolase family protein [Flagellimonas pacifica]|nr:prolyl oligopeptidase family serine peptidase [Allomuricauda parva]
MEFKKEGTFTGVFSYGNFKDKITLEIRKDAAKWQVRFTSLEQNAFQISAREVIVRLDSINFKLQSDTHTYDFRNKWNEKKNRLTGTLRADTVSVRYSLKREKSTNENSVESKEVHFMSEGLKRGGTVWKGKKSNKKGIVFISSSGNGGRSGSRAEAIYFANKGFTTFHYDKRGTGVSEGNWQSATMNELLSDDLNAIRYFSEQTGIPLSQIGIKGSSQGATKIPFILNKLDDLNFGIVVSCPGSTLLESDLNHWKNSNSETLGNDLEIAAEFQRKVFEHIAGKLSRGKLESILEDGKTKSWFSSVWIPNLDEVQIDEKLSFSPIPYFEQTKQPLLVIQGIADKIIPIASHQTISTALKNARNKKHKIVLLENANHSMYFVGESDFPYWAKLHDDYLKTIDKWINSNIP